METETLFSGHQEAIIDHAVFLLHETPLNHYQHLSEENCRQRYRRLFFIVLKCMKKQSISDIIEYIRHVARERFSSGYGLQEVQSACNIMEEVMRYYLLHIPSPPDFQTLSDSLNLLCRIFCAGKDILSDYYVIMATERQRPDIDVSALFKGV